MRRMGRWTLGWAVAVLSVAGCDDEGGETVADAAAVADAGRDAEADADLPADAARLDFSVVPRVDAAPGFDLGVLPDAAPLPPRYTVTLQGMGFPTVEAGVLRGVIIDDQGQAVSGYNGLAADSTWTLQSTEILADRIYHADLLLDANENANCDPWEWVARFDFGPHGADTELIVTPDQLAVGSADACLSWQMQPTIPVSVSGVGFPEYPAGTVLWGVLRDGAQLASLPGTATAEEGAWRFDFLEDAVSGRPYVFDFLADVDGDERCGPAEHVFRLDVGFADLAVELTLDYATAERSEDACAAWGLAP